jgi:hypothetical protein
MLIKNCYSTGSAEMGGFYAYAYLEGYIDFRSCYWDTQTSGQAGNGSVEIISGGLGSPTGKNTSQMKTQSTFVNWDFERIWSINPASNNGYPILEYSEYIPNTIETLSAKNVFENSATVGGKYTAGNDTHVEMGIQWRPKGLIGWTSYWWARSPYYIAWNLTYWVTLMGLGPARTFEYRAFYKIGSTYYYGSTLTFTTTRTPAVFTYPGTEYRTAKQALDDVAKVGVGRYYADQAGNFQYESRLRRLA